MRSSRLVGLALAAVVVLTAGCGGDDNSSKADMSTATSTQAPSPATTPSTTTDTTPGPSGNTKKDPTAGRVVQNFYNAMARRDGPAACTYLNAELKHTAVAIVKRVPANHSIKMCGDALTASVRPNNEAQLRTLHNVKILGSTAEGALATVKVKGAPRDVLLTRAQGHWLISAGVFRTSTS